jgi:hypothetical protein
MFSAGHWSVSSSHALFAPLFSLGETILEFLVTLLAIQSGGWFDSYSCSVLPLSVRHARSFCVCINYFHPLIGFLVCLHICWHQTVQHMCLLWSGCLFVLVCHGWTRWFRVWSAGGRRSLKWVGGTVVCVWDFENGVGHVLVGLINLIWMVDG